MYGVAIQGRDAKSALEQIQRAEAMGVQAAWGTINAAGGTDMVPVFAAAAVTTRRILLGTAIIHTWSRHPLAAAQEAMAIEHLAPGRFRLGVGPSAPGMIAQMYGLGYQKPLSHLSEYLRATRELLHTGKVDFEGEFITARGELNPPAPIPVMAAALRPRSYEIAGALSDGAISWMCPLGYLTGLALPALKRGANAAGRETPPLIAHVPVSVDMDREAVRTLARLQLGRYARVPNYQGMFAAAGYDVSDGYPDALLDDLVVSGTEAEVAAGLQRWRDAGMAEVIAHPLLNRADIEGSIERGFGAAARAASS